MRFGIEIELFLVKGGVVAYPNYMLPKDGDGLLVEARGTPHSCPHQAIHSALAEIDRLRAEAKKGKLGTLKLWNHLDLEEKFISEHRRTHGKDPSNVFNMRGLHYPHGERIYRAGLHVHFSEPSHTIKEKGGRDYQVFDQANIPHIINTLDREFAQEIEEAHRLPGFYELKPYGFEYRSLPNNVNLKKLVEVLEELKDE